jgi:TDG/mug DNA glycosylase family protein
MSQARRRSFPPVIGDSPEILVLGSMPGEESLRQARYYAHPKNAFWPVMAELLGFKLEETPYPKRLEALKRNRIALWDVLESCVRPGSLDADIRNAKPNDFAKLFRQTPSLRRVVCNGETARRLFEKHAAHLLPPGCEVFKAPSTSPAFASLRFEKKLELWRAALAR